MIRKVQIKKSFYIPFWMYVCFLLLPASLVGQEISKLKTSDGIGYLELLPPDYQTSPNKKYPVIIFLHGIGERGDGSPEALEIVKKNGPPREIKNGHNMCFNVNGVEQCFIVISPQLVSGGWTASYTDRVIDYVIETYRVDLSRIYLTGLSLGGKGVWVYAQSRYNNPNKLAAIAPVASWGSTENICFLAENHVPVWAFHGDKDGTIPLASGQRQIDALNACSPAPNPAPIFTIYPGVGHDSWSRAYRTDHSLHEPNLYEWLLMQQKGTTTAPGAPVPPNQVPVVNAGKDLLIVLPEQKNVVTLNGSATDSDGKIISYQWTQESGTKTVMTNVETSALTVSNLQKGQYTFRLTAKDNSGASAFDEVKIVVEEIENILPVVQLEPEISVTLLQTDTLKISGNIFDEDGKIVSYDWTQEAGPSANMVNAQTESLLVTGLDAGAYTFRVTIKDNRGGSAFDEIVVNVKKPNLPPTAIAGNNFEIELPQISAVLEGSGKDADGSIVSYQWKQMAGLPVSIENPRHRICDVSGFTEGSYTFCLVVTDNEGAKAIDELKIDVKPEPKGEPGLVYKYYEGFWGKLPRFEKLKPKAIGKVSNFSLTPRLQDDYFAFTFEGYIDIKLEGNYTFYLNSNDGSKLFIDGVEVVRNDYVHAPREKSGSVTLAAGLHEILVTYFEKENKEVLDVLFSGPGVQKQLIPNDILFIHKNRSNLAPIANAGEDVFITLPVDHFSIIGSGFDADDDALNFVWKQTGGEPVSSMRAENNELFLYNLEEGTFTFELTVTDEMGESDTDQINVKVTDDIHGVKYSYYEGNWDKLPNFDRLTPKATGFVNNFSLSPKLEVNYFGFKFESFIEIAKDGDYTFYLLSNDGSKLIIDSNVVINNDGVHSQKLKTGTVHLKAGLHPIKVVYFDKLSGEVLDLQYSSSDFGKMKIPFNVLYRDVLPDQIVVSSLEQETVSIVEKLNVYPNPINQVMYIDFEGELMGEVSINIMDQNGQILYAEVANLEVANSLEVYLSSFNLSQGLFYLTATDAAGNTKTIRLYKN